MFPIFHLIFLMKLLPNFNKKKQFFLPHFQKSTPYFEKIFLVNLQEVRMKLANFNLCEKYIPMSQVLVQFFFMKLVNNFIKKNKSIPYLQVLEIFPQILIGSASKFDFFIKNVVKLISKIGETTSEYLKAFSS